MPSVMYGPASTGVLVGAGRRRLRSKPGSEARCTTCWHSAGASDSSGSTGPATHSHSSRPRSALRQPSSAATRSREASTPMTAEASSKPFKFRNSMAGPFVRVGRITVPPAPTYLYTPESSASGSTSTSVSTSCPGLFLRNSSAERRSRTPFSKRSIAKAPFKSILMSKV